MKTLNEDKNIPVEYMKKDALYSILLFKIMDKYSLYNLDNKVSLLILVYKRIRILLKNQQIVFLSAVTVHSVTSNLSAPLHHDSFLCPVPEQLSECHQYNQPDDLQ